MSGRHHGIQVLRRYSTSKQTVRGALPHVWRLSFGQTQRAASEDRALLRALLRECTYLPDDFARSYCQQHILSRFHEYHVKDWSDFKDEEKQYRIIKCRATARKALHMLEEANSGYHRSLNRVLLLVYGRRGKRRRVLMTPLYAETHTASQPSTEKHKDRSAEWINFTPAMTPQMQAVARAQNRSHIAGNFAIARPKNLALRPTIAATNAWGRPMPLIRVKHKTEEWWANFLAKVLPPLPTAEWLRLYDLASKNEVLPPIKRRIMHINRGHTNFLEETIKAKGGRITPPKDKVRFSRPRSVHRSIVEIFNLCPHLSWDAQLERYNVCWGHQALRNPTLAEAIREEHTRSQLSF